MDTMQALQPRWVEVFNKSQRQRDFYIAIWTYESFEQEEIIEVVK
jgi:NADPH-dependent 7-cyano-7-deazaguanine reductase QueF